MSKPDPLYGESFGYSLAMHVMQSDLYRRLNQKERAECDELIARGQGRAVPALVQPEPSRMASFPFDRLEQVIDAYLEDYEMVGEDAEGRDGCYQPNERERFLIKDAIVGLLAHGERDAEWGRLIEQRARTLSASPSASQPEPSDSTQPPKVPSAEVWGVVHRDTGYVDKVGEYEEDVSYTLVSGYEKRKGIAYFPAASASLTPPAPEATNACPPGWVTEAFEAIWTARPGTKITDDMKRAAAIALRLARGERWDDSKQDWAAAPVPSPEPREPVAWMSEDGERVVPASAKATADRSGGASASAMRAYPIALVPRDCSAAPPSLPETVTDAKSPASCMCCGYVGERAVWKCDDKDTYVCKRCHARATGSPAADVMAALDSLHHSACEHHSVAGMGEYEVIRTALAHIGKRPAMSEDAKDAARYRWLRDNREEQARDGTIRDVYDEDGTMLYGADLDAAIDAALSTAPAQPTQEKAKLICTKCGADRFQVPCPGPLMDCPIRGEALSAQPTTEGGQQ